MSNRPSVARTAHGHNVPPNSRRATSNRADASGDSTINTTFTSSRKRTADDLDAGDASARRKHRDSDSHNHEDLTMASSVVQDTNREAGSTNATSMTNAQRYCQPGREDGAATELVEEIPYTRPSPDKRPRLNFKGRTTDRSSRTSNLAFRTSSQTPLPSPTSGSAQPNAGSGRGSGDPSISGSRPGLGTQNTTRTKPAANTSGNGEGIGASASTGSNIGRTSNVIQQAAGLVVPGFTHYQIQDRSSTSHRAQAVQSPRHPASNVSASNSTASTGGRPTASQSTGDRQARPVPAAAPQARGSTTRQVATAATTSNSQPAPSNVRIKVESDTDYNTTGPDPAQIKTQNQARLLNKWTSKTTDYQQQALIENKDRMKAVRAVNDKRQPLNLSANASRKATFEFWHRKMTDSVLKHADFPRTNLDPTIPNNQIELVFCSDDAAATDVGRNKVRGLMPGIPYIQHNATDLEFDAEDARNPPVVQFLDCFHPDMKIQVQDLELEWESQVVTKHITVGELRARVTKRVRKDGRYQALDMPIPTGHASDVIPRHIKRDSDAWLLTDFDNHIQSTGWVRGEGANEQREGSMIASRSGHDVKRRLDKVKPWGDKKQFGLVAEGGCITAPSEDSFGMFSQMTVHQGRLLVGWLSVAEVTDKQRDHVFYNGMMTGEDLDPSLPWRCIILGPGDTMAMSPGTVYCTIRLETEKTLILGSHFLRRSQVPEWAEVMVAQMNHPVSSNEFDYSGCTDFVHVFREILEKAQDNVRGGLTIGSLGGARQLDLALGKLKQLEGELRQSYGPRLNGRIAAASDVDGSEYGGNNA